MSITSLMFLAFWKECTLNSSILKNGVFSLYSRQGTQQPERKYPPKDALGSLNATPSFIKATTEP